jgi:hypothetical protein
MASGLVRRANRPNTWLHRPACKREKSLANSEPVISCPPTKIVFSADGSEVDTRVETLRAIYASEIAEADAFDRQANALCKEFAIKKEAATEAVS